MIAPSITPSLHDLLLKLAKNQVFLGGAMLMVSGAALALMRGVPMSIWQVIRNRMLTRIEVTSDTAPYPWIQHWLSRHKYTERNRNVLLTEMPRAGRGHGHGQPFGYADDEAPVARVGHLNYGEEELSEYALLPGNGSHLFWWNHRPVWLSFSREKTMATGGRERVYVHSRPLDIHLGSVVD